MAACLRDHPAAGVAAVRRHEPADDRWLAGESRLREAVRTGLERYGETLNDVDAMVRERQRDERAARARASLGPAGQRVPSTGALSFCGRAARPSGLPSCAIGTGRLKSRISLEMPQRAPGCAVVGHGWPLSARTEAGRIAFPWWRTCSVGTLGGRAGERGRESCAVLLFKPPDYGMPLRMCRSERWSVPQRRPTGTGLAVPPPCPPSHPSLPSSGRQPRHHGGAHHRARGASSTPGPVRRRRRTRLPKPHSASSATTQWRTGPGWWNRGSVVRRPGSMSFDRPGNRAGARRAKVFVVIDNKDQVTTGFVEEARSVPGVGSRRSTCSGPGAQPGRLPL